MITSMTTSSSTSLVLQWESQYCLADMLNRGARKFNISQARTLVIQCLHGVDYLHRRTITHGSILPEHILVVNEEPLKVVLCGFGAARSIAPPRADLRTFTRIDMQSIGLITLEALLWPQESEPQHFSGHSLDICWTAHDASPSVHYTLAALLCSSPGHDHPAHSILQSLWLRTTIHRKRRRVPDDCEPSIGSVADMRPAKRAKLYAAPSDEIINDSHLDPHFEELSLHPNIPWISLEAAHSAVVRRQPIAASHPNKSSFLGRLVSGLRHAAREEETTPTTYDDFQYQLRQHATDMA